MSGFAMRLSMDSDPIRALLSKVEHIADKKNTYVLLDTIGGYLDSETTQRFQDSVGPDGQPWTPSQRAIDDGGKTLLDTTVLSKSFTHKVAPDAQSVAHGSKKDYSAIHHFGGKTGRNNKTTIIARPIIGINADDEDEIESITDLWAYGLLK